MINLPAFDFLPLGSFQPTGWLRQQLRIQADGLSGHLDLFWPDIADSRWIGGSHEGWERVPYWLDGFIPLAWLLDDETLKARAARYIDQILSGQEEDGWICPCTIDKRASYDVWALFLILKALTVHADASGDPRVAPAIHRALKNLDRHIDHHTLFGWGQTRWYESLISIYWLYRQQPEPWLVDLAVKLHAQGTDYPALFDHWPYRQPAEKGRWSLMNHVVNQAMMLKGWALYSLISGQESDRTAASRMLGLLDDYHGQMHGLFSGDECLAGLSPISGTELCAVVEFMYSMEHLLAVTGDPVWADRLEHAAFNALPATFSADMWTHQYDQQVNQVECSVQENSVFGTNGGDANLFGLEPNFGCCTANLSQGWPKFARSLVMRDPGPAGGLAVVAYAPTDVSTSIGSKSVRLSMKTDYPFRDTIQLEVTVSDQIADVGSAVGQNAVFPLSLRIPAWADGATVTFGSETLAAAAGTMMTLKRDWTGRTMVGLHLPMKAIWQKRPNNMAALVRGPLVYSLPIPERWRQINQDMPGHELPHGDFEVLPAGPWQYGIPAESIGRPDQIEWREAPVGNQPFSQNSNMPFSQNNNQPFSHTVAPVSAQITAAPVEWHQENGSATPEPVSRTATGPAVTLRLIPYGCTNLRLTEWPLIDDPC